MNKINTIKNFDELVSDFIGLLTEPEKQKLVNLKVINPFIAEAGIFFDKIEDRYKLSTESSRFLLKVIADENPDKLSNMDFLDDFADPSLGAGLILERARKLLDSKKSHL